MVELEKVKPGDWLKVEVDGHFFELQVVYPTATNILFIQKGNRVRIDPRKCFGIEITDEWMRKLSFTLDNGYWTLDGVNWEQSQLEDLKYVHLLQRETEYIKNIQSKSGCEF